MDVRLQVLLDSQGQHCATLSIKGDATVSPEGKVPMPMYIFGDCCHIKDKSTGKLCGDKLVEYAVKLVKEKKVTKRPKNILKDEHHILSLSKTHSKDFGGRPLALSAAKNLKILKLSLASDVLGGSWWRVHT